MKRLLIISVLFLIMHNAYSQQTKIGVFVDPQITWIEPDSRNTTSNGSLMGVDGGLIIEQYFQKNYALQSGISLGTIGGKVKLGEPVVFTTYNEDTTLAPGTNVEFRLSYITLPIGLKLNTNPIGYFSYFARLGFTNQFNIKARGTSSDHSLVESNIADEIFIYNLSYYFGIGAQYNLSEDTAIILGINYNNGFVNILTENSLKAYTRSISLRLGVIF